MKYPELKGKCKNCTLGCFRLEDEKFEGTNECEYAENGLEMCKRILEEKQCQMKIL